MCDPLKEKKKKPDRCVFGNSFLENFLNIYGVQKQVSYFPSEKNSDQCAKLNYMDKFWRKSSDFCAKFAFWIEVQFLFEVSEIKRIFPNPED